MNEQNSYAHKRKIENIYCATSEKTSEKCLQSDALLNYDEENLTFLEIPFEQYEEVVVLLQQKMQIPIEKVVKKGAFTYLQVKHMAEVCNIHNLRVDEHGQINFLNEQFGISAAISFAQSKWNGASRPQAIENAILTGLTIIGEPFAQEIIEEELKQIDASEHIELSGGVREAVRVNGSKAVAKKMATKVTNKAMMSSMLAKKTILMLNANVVTGALVTGVMSTVDIVRAIKGEMSPSQLFKNVSKTAASVAGGIAGTILGGGVGLTIPNVSTAVISIIGGIIGLIIGSVLASKLMKKILDKFIKDDSTYMLEIFNEQLSQLAEQYLLNEKELQQVLNDFNELYDMPDVLRDMYASDDRVQFARDVIDKELYRTVRQRMYLRVPSNKEIFEVLQTME